MTVQSANSLLKFIEEPEGGLLLLFLTTNPGQILPTIQSRLQPVTFKSLTFDSLLASLTAAGISEQKRGFMLALLGVWKKRRLLKRVSGLVRQEMLSSSYMKEFTIKEPAH